MAPDPDHTAGAGPAGRGDLMERAVDGAIRLGRAWKVLSRERRIAAIAAGVLWLTLFLPWYQASVVGRDFRTRGAAPVSDSLSGWASFGFAQALILIVSVGILLFLFLRAEGRAGDVPGGDGRVVTGAGVVSLLLVIIGLFSAPSPATHGGYVVSTGLEWGIFVALLSAAGLTWAGRRIRRSLEDDSFLAENRRGSAQATPPEEPQDSAPDEAEPSSPAPVRAPEPAPGGAEPLTAAATSATSPTDTTDATGDQSEDQPEPDPEAAPTEQVSRSSWRPAERPDWTDPERPRGWLTAPPKHQGSEDETE